MYIVDVIEDWVESNKEVLTDIPNDKKFSKIDVVSLLNRFSYNEDIYLIASRLFQKMYQLILFECVADGRSYDTFKHEIYLLSDFCCLGEYGRELTSDYFLEVVEWDNAKFLLEDYRGGISAIE